jgi:hypothetical protein
MSKKHTRTLTSTLLKPSDSETGNGERLLPFELVRYTQSYGELLYASRRPCTLLHCVWASALLFQVAAINWCRLAAPPCHHTHLASTSPQEEVGVADRMLHHQQQSIPLSSIVCTLPRPRPSCRQTPARSA